MKTLRSYWDALLLGWMWGSILAGFGRRSHADRGTANSKETVRP